ncbi:MAG: DUF58 domain-containing protein [Planctomycetota bacterium]
MSMETLDPVVLARISNLTLRARYVVEGVLSGLHRSPHRGSSVEFVEHKEYSPGDELKHVDWKVLGRSDKYYVKQFEDETNLKAHLLLDASGSMGYTSGPVTKLEYGRTLAASLAYLMLNQRDGVGLVTFSTRALRYIPPRSKSSHLQALVEALDAVRPEGETSLSAVLSDLAEKMKRRGLLIVISDLFDSPEAVLGALRQFRHRRHEVIVFHVLDPAEVEFPFHGLTLFRSMEDSRRVAADPDRIRESYRDEVRKFIQMIRQECLSHQIDYNLVSTAQPLDQALAEYLAAREKLLWEVSPSSIQSS